MVQCGSEYIHIYFSGGRCYSYTLTVTTVTVTVTVCTVFNVCYGLLCWAVACCDDMCTLLFTGAYPRKFHVELFFYLAYRKFELLV